MIKHFNLCAEGHEEIVFRWGSGCPVCPLLKKVQEQEDELIEARDKLSCIDHTIFEDFYPDSL